MVFFLCCAAHAHSHLRELKYWSWLSSSSSSRNSDSGSTTQQFCSVVGLELWCTILLYSMHQQMFLLPVKKHQRVIMILLDGNHHHHHRFHHHFLPIKKRNENDMHWVRRRATLRTVLLWLVELEFRRSMFVVVPRLPRFKMVLNRAFKMTRVGSSSSSGVQARPGQTVSELACALLLLPTVTFILLFYRHKIGFGR